MKGLHASHLCCPHSISEAIKPLSASAHQHAEQQGPRVPPAITRQHFNPLCCSILCLQDWEQEYRHSGMRTFLAVPVAASSSEPMLGVLTLASCQAGAFWESW
jgi:GAF domain-containing protein